VVSVFAVIFLVLPNGPVRSVPFKIIVLTVIDGLINLHTQRQEFSSGFNLQNKARDYPS
jgi:hypothetical protein